MSLFIWLKSIPNCNDFFNRKTNTDTKYALCVSTRQCTKKIVFGRYSPHTDLYRTSFLLQSRPEKYARKVALLFFATPSRTK